MYEQSRIKTIGNYTLFNNNKQRSSIGCWEWDFGSNTIKCSEEVFEVYDINPDTFDGTLDAFLFTLQSEDLEVYTNNTLYHLPRGKSIPFEYRIIFKDGSIHNLYANGKIEYSLTEKPIRYLGFVQDISDINKATNQKKVIDQLVQFVNHIGVNKNDDIFLYNQERLSYIKNILYTSNSELDSFRQNIHEKGSLNKISNISINTNKSIRIIEKFILKNKIEIIHKLGPFEAIEWFTNKIFKDRNVQITIKKYTGVIITEQSSLIFINEIQKVILEIERFSNTTLILIKLNKLKGNLIFSIYVNGIIFTKINKKMIYSYKTKKKRKSLA